MRKLLIALCLMSSPVLAADNIAVTAGAGTTVGSDEIVDGTLGTVKVQMIKLMDGTLDGTNKAVVDSAGNLKVTASISGSSNTVSAAQSGTWDEVGINDSGNSITVDNTGTFAVQASQSGGAFNVVSTNTVIGTGSNTIGALTANQSVNVAQVNGVAPSMGSGVNGTGVRRVTMATDQAPYGVLFSTVAVDRTGTEIVWVSTFANVAASQTDSALVGAVASKMICVHMLAAVTGGTATNLTFNSKPAGAGTAISPAFANGINGGEVLPYAPIPWFCSTAGEGLTVTTGAGTTTGILVKYMTH